MNHMNTADILNFTTSFITLRPGSTVCVLTPESVMNEIQVKSGGKTCKEAKAELEKKLQETSDKKDL